MPEYTASADGIGTIRLLEAIRDRRPAGQVLPGVDLGDVGATPPPQDETTAFYPRSPYGAAKLYAHWVTVNYREAYDMFAVSGILFNHESPRRGETFVTRKITLGVAAIKAGTKDRLVLGNLDSVRDWGYAKEYVEGMWRMLQQDEPDDFVLGTGVGTTVKEFCEYCLQPRRARLAGPREPRRPLRATDRGRRADRRPDQGREVLGWKPRPRASRSWPPSWSTPTWRTSPHGDHHRARHRGGRSGRDPGSAPARRRGPPRGRHDPAGLAVTSFGLPRRCRDRGARPVRRGGHAPRCR